jgi:type IV secretory pathway VirB2 component (pilin)
MNRITRVLASRHFTSTAQTVMLCAAVTLLLIGGDALAFSQAVQGVGAEICNVYKAIKGYVAPAVAVLMFAIAFVELKTGNRGAQGRASAAFFGALFFANIGAIVQLTKLPIASCPA